MLHLRGFAIPLQPFACPAHVYDHGTMLAADRHLRCKIKKLILKRVKCRKLLIANGGGFKRRMLRDTR